MGKLCDSRNLLSSTSMSSHAEQPQTSNSRSRNTTATLIVSPTQINFTHPVTSQKLTSATQNPNQNLQPNSTRNGNAPHTYQVMAQPLDELPMLQLKKSRQFEAMYRSESSQEILQKKPVGNFPQIRHRSQAVNQSQTSKSSSQQGHVKLKLISEQPFTQTDEAEGLVEIPTQEEDSTAENTESNNIVVIEDLHSPTQIPEDPQPNILVARYTQPTSSTAVLQTETHFKLVKDFSQLLIKNKEAQESTKNVLFQQACDLDYFTGYIPGIKSYLKNHKSFRKKHRLIDEELEKTHHTKRTESKRVVLGFERIEQKGYELVLDQNKQDSTTQQKPQSQSSDSDSDEPQELQISQLQPQLQRVNLNRRADPRFAINRDMAYVLKELSDKYVNLAEMAFGQWSKMGDLTITLAEASLSLRDQFLAQQSLQTKKSFQEQQRRNQSQMAEYTRIAGLRREEQEIIRQRIREEMTTNIAKTLKLQDIELDKAQLAQQSSLTPELPKSQLKPSIPMQVEMKYDVRSSFGKLVNALNPTAFKNQSQRGVKKGFTDVQRKPTDQFVLEPKTFHSQVDRDRDSRNHSVITMQLETINEKIGNQSALLKQLDQHIGPQSLKTHKRIPPISQQDTQHVSVTPNLRKPANIEDIHFRHQSSTPQIKLPEITSPHHFSTEVKTLSLNTQVNVKMMETGHHKQWEHSKYIGSQKNRVAQLSTRLKNHQSKQNMYKSMVSQLSMQTQNRQREWLSRLTQDLNNLMPPSTTNTQL